MQATAELVVEKGLAGVTTRQICERARIHPSVISRLFGGKQELIREVALRKRLAYVEAISRTDDPVQAFHLGLEHALGDREWATIFGQVVLGPNADPDIARVHPALTRHIAQLRNRAETERSSEGRSPSSDAEAPGPSEPLGDPRFTALMGAALIGGWAVWESFAMAGPLRQFDLSDVRRAVHQVLEDLLRREIERTESET